MTPPGRQRRSVTDSVRWGGGNWGDGAEEWGGWVPIVIVAESRNIILALIVVMRVDSSRAYWKVDLGVSAKLPNFAA